MIKHHITTSGWAWLFWLLSVSTGFGVEKTDLIPCDPLRLLVPNQVMGKVEKEEKDLWFTFEVWVAKKGEEQVYVFNAEPVLIPATETVKDKERSGWTRWDEVAHKYSNIDYSSLPALGKGKARMNQAGTLFYIEPEHIVDVHFDATNKTFECKPTNINAAPRFSFETLEHLRVVMAPKAFRPAKADDITGSVSLSLHFGSEFAAGVRQSPAIFAKAGETDEPNQLIFVNEDHVIWLPIPNGVTARIARMAFNIPTLQPLHDAKFRRLRSLASSSIDVEDSGRARSSADINEAFKSKVHAPIDPKQALRTDREWLFFHDKSKPDEANHTDRWRPRNRFQESFFAPIPQRSKSPPGPGPLEFRFDSTSPPKVDGGEYFHVEIAKDGKTYYPRAIDSAFHARFILILGDKPFYVQETEMTVRQLAALAGNTPDYANLDPVVIADRLFAVNGRGSQAASLPVKSLTGATSKLTPEQQAEVERQLKLAEQSTSSSEIDPRAEGIRSLWRRNAALFSVLSQVDGAEAQGWRNEFIFLGLVMQQSYDLLPKNGNASNADTEVISQYWDLTLAKLQRYVEYRAARWLLFLAESKSTAASIDLFAQRKGISVVNGDDKMLHLTTELFWENHFYPVYGDHRGKAALCRALNDAKSMTARRLGEFVTPLDDPVVFLSPNATVKLINLACTNNMNDFRLPTSDEFALLSQRAVGAHVRNAPGRWGNTVAVGDRFQQMAGYQVYDIAGNMSEWTTDGNIGYALMGGSFRGAHEANPLNRPAYAVHSAQHAFAENIGLRLILDPQATATDPAGGSNPQKSATSSSGATPQAETKSNEVDANGEYYLSEAVSENLFSAYYESVPTVPNKLAQPWYQTRMKVRKQLGESTYWELMFIRQLLLGESQSDDGYLDSSDDGKVLWLIKDRVPNAFPADQ